MKAVLHTCRFHCQRIDTKSSVTLSRVCGFTECLRQHSSWVWTSCTAGALTNRGSRSQLRPPSSVGACRRGHPTAAPWPPSLLSDVCLPLALTGAGVFEDTSSPLSCTDLCCSRAADWLDDRFRDPPFLLVVLIRACARSVSGIATSGCSTPVSVSPQVRVLELRVRHPELREVATA